jgi:hypothetical protein
MTPLPTHQRRTTTPPPRLEDMRRILDASLPEQALSRGIGGRTDARMPRMLITNQTRVTSAQARNRQRRRP